MVVAGFGFDLVHAKEALAVGGDIALVGPECSDVNKTRGIPSSSLRGRA